MGAGQSIESRHTPPAQGLHVLRVAPSSPASRTNIEPFFDFVVGFDDESFSTLKSLKVSDLQRVVERHENRPLNLLVWSSKHGFTRSVPIIPSRAWSSSTHRQKSPLSSSGQSLLGLSMKICEPQLALDNVWHVLDVLEGSPAESAGLVPYGDWIIGWSGGVLAAENDFYDLIESHVDKPLRVYVYSLDFDALREVVLVPNRHWGGDGLLGCVFGFGLLHRIPSQKGGDPSGLSEEDEFIEPADEEETFVPADVQFNNRGHIPSVSSHRHQSPSSEETDEEYDDAADRTYTHAGRASNLIAPIPSRPYTNGDSQHP